LNRRTFLEYFTSLRLTSSLFPGLLWAQQNRQNEPRITKEMLQSTRVMRVSVLSSPNCVTCVRREAVFWHRPSEGGQYLSRAQLSYSVI
jgi:hypothetical protein